MQRIDNEDIHILSLHLVCLISINKIKLNPLFFVIHITNKDTESPLIHPQISITLYWSRDHMRMKQKDKYLLITYISSW